MEQRVKTTQNIIEDDAAMFLEVGILRSGKGNDDDCLLYAYKNVLL